MVGKVAVVVLGLLSQDVDVVTTREILERCLESHCTVRGVDLLPEQVALLALVGAVEAEALRAAERILRLEAERMRGALIAFLANDILLNVEGHVRVGKTLGRRTLHLHCPLFSQMQVSPLHVSASVPDTSQLHGSQSGKLKKPASQWSHLWPTYPDLHLH